MRITDCMSRDVSLIGPDETLEQAALQMVEIDAGVLPVADGDRLVGMLTDRDIAIRGVAQGLGPEAKVRDVMTREVLYCFEHEEVDDVLRNMADIKVRRLPVLNGDKRLVGIVSLTDMDIGAGRPPAAEALKTIAQPGGPHSQTLH